MKKFIYTINLLLLYCVNANAQNNLVGKTFVAEVGLACKIMADGGCSIYTYRVFKFEKDSVFISYRVKADCPTKANENRYEHIYDHLKETHKWTINNGIITIENFNDYGKLTMQQSKLIGKTDQVEKLEFSEEPR